MKHLLIEGNSGIGKTTLILKSMNRYREDIGGFITQRVVEENNQTRGFCLKRIGEIISPRCVITDSNEIIPNLFIENMDGHWQKHPEIFAKTGIEVINELITNRAKLAVLDEIGGIELNSECFVERLIELLKGDIPCLIVLKNNGNYEALKRHIPLSVDYDSKRADLEKILHSYRCERVLLNESNAEQVEKKISNFIQVHVKGEANETKE